MGENVKIIKNLIFNLNFSDIPKLQKIFHT